MKNWRINIEAPLSFGHLPQGESKERRRKLKGIRNDLTDLSRSAADFTRHLTDLTPGATDLCPEVTDLTPETADLTPKVADRTSTTTDLRKWEARSSKIEARNLVPEEPRHRSSVIGQGSLANFYLLLTTNYLKLATCSSQLSKYNQRGTLSPLLWIYSHGRGRERLLKYNQCSLLSPPLRGGWEGLFSLLPRGSAGSGATPGAAAITTIISFLFSSPRGAPVWESEFLIPAQKKCGVVPKGFLRKNSASRSATRLAAHSRLAHKGSLPVINQSTFHQGSFVPLYRNRG